MLDGPIASRFFSSQVGPVPRANGEANRPPAPSGLLDDTGVDRWGRIARTGVDNWGRNHTRLAYIKGLGEMAERTGRPAWTHEDNKHNGMGLYWGRLLG